MAARSSPFFKSRRQQPLTPAEVGAWPTVDPLAIVDPVKRSRYTRLDRAITLLAHGTPMGEAAKVAKLDSSRLRKLIQKAREEGTDGRPWGYRALVSRSARKTYVRDIPLDKKAVSGGKGLSGAFGKLLRTHPSISRGLTDFLNQRKLQSIISNFPSWARLQKRFIELCREAGVEEDAYPLGTHTQGKNALRCWVKTVYIPAHLHIWLEKTENPEAARASQNSLAGDEKYPSLSPYCIWQIDEYTIDLIAQYEMLDQLGNYVKLILDRIQCILCILPDSGAVLAWILVLGRQTDVSSLMGVLWNSIAGQPSPKVIIPGLIDLEGAGYPSTRFSELRFAAPRRIYLDNALAHLARAFHQKVQGQWGATVVNGTAATPKERASVESHIGLLAKQLMRELPGATGSHPRDPVRSRSKLTAKHAIDVDMLEALLDNYFKNKNAEAVRASHYSSPLEKIERQLKSGAIRLNHLPISQQREHLFFEETRVTVKQCLKDGRLPFVNYLGCRYSSPALRKSIDLVGKKFVLKVGKDLRNIYLFQIDSGQEFMTLSAEGEWGKIPHTSRFRKAAFKMARAGYLDGRNHDRLLMTALNYLRAGAPKDRLRGTQLAEFMMHVRDHLPELSGEYRSMCQEYFAEMGATEAAQTHAISVRNSITASPFKIEAKEGAETTHVVIESEFAGANVITLRNVSRRRII